MIIIDSSATTPAFEQIKQQIAEQRDSGVLPAGHRLPPVRQLAAELGLADNTVARAYRELEASGVIETRGRHGSFVTGTAQTADRAAAAAARDYVETIRRLQISDDRAVELVRKALLDA